MLFRFKRFLHFLNTFLRQKSVQRWKKYYSYVFSIKKWPETARNDQKWFYKKIYFMNLDIFSYLFRMKFLNEIYSVYCVCSSGLSFWRFNIGGATSWALKFRRLPPQWHSSKILSLSFRQPFYIQYYSTSQLHLTYFLTSKVWVMPKRDFAVNFRAF